MSIETKYLLSEERAPNIVIALEGGELEGRPSRLRQQGSDPPHQVQRRDPEGKTSTDAVVLCDEVLFFSILESLNDVQLTMTVPISDFESCHQCMCDQLGCVTVHVTVIVLASLALF